MKKKHVKMALKTSLLPALVLASLSWKGISENSDNPPVLKIDGLEFADLNYNGKLDVYEDYRRTLEDRINDLVDQMTDEEKASFLIGTGMPGFDGLTPVVGAIEGRVPGGSRRYL